jgi:hypothetical protein
MQSSLFSLGVNLATFGSKILALKCSLLFSQSILHPLNKSFPLSGNLTLFWIHGGNDFHCKSFSQFNDNKGLHTSFISHLIKDKVLCKFFFFSAPSLKEGVSIQNPL